MVYIDKIYGLKSSLIPALTLFQVLSVINSMRLCQVQSLDRKIPRCLLSQNCSILNSSVHPLNKRLLVVVYRVVLGTWRSNVMLRKQLSGVNIVYTVYCIDRRSDDRQPKICLSYTHSVMERLQPHRLMSNIRYNDKQ